MISLLRKKRKKELDNTENKNRSTGKYFKYAIGEIILVVIGILIALQVNNWNETRKTYQQEKEYLEVLRQEFLINGRILKRTTELLSTQIETGKELLALCAKKDIQESEEAVSLLFSKTFANEITYIPRDGVVKDILTSGKLSIIRNPLLRSKIAAWEGNISDIRIPESGVQNMREEITKILIENGSIINILTSVGALKYDNPSFKKTNKEILQLEEFENSLALLIVRSRGLTGQEYLELDQEIQSILELIDTSISSKKSE